MHIFHRGAQDGQTVEFPQLKNMPEKTTERLLGEYKMTNNKSFQLPVLCYTTHAQIVRDVQCYL